MINMASSVMTLFPGDILATGTHAGVGPLNQGDVLRIQIAGVGSMTLNVMRDPAAAHPVWNK
jgi:2-keto-4-pentenoate hydratase/2-oxohepta-3-ene-1,7-dioic acid hydratase in catechol pathway